MLQQAQRFVSNLAALGAKRLAMLGIVGLAVALTVGFGSYYLSKPDTETLYTGLTPQDTSRMGAALADAGIPFDVSADGTKVLVAPSRSAEARVLLAEKGLPASATSGYELFDKIGSMGLTSFMQEVTRVRALEGELARTIQTIRGVKAARVHIVLPDAASFRHESRKPSASVVIRPESANEFGGARAIRHLVAAAVPGMGIEQVQVVSTDGTVLSADGDAAGETTNKLLDIERAVSAELQNKVKRTLTPYLGAENFEISVAAKVNMDKRQTSETAFDPKSRVERSLRVVKDVGNTQNANTRNAVSVEQNIPGEDQQAAQGETSRKSNERREELTNYEISSKQTSVESQGFRVEQVALAILVNKKRIVAAAGAGASAADIEARLKEVEALARSSAGIETGRGDQVTVAAVDFLQTPGSLDPVASEGTLSALAAHTGSLIRALTIVGVAALLIWFGLRPVTRALSLPPPEAQLTQMAAAGAAALPGSTQDSGQAVAAGARNAQIGQGRIEPSLTYNPADDGGALGDLARKAGRSITRQLESIVDQDEQQAAAILKQWVNAPRTSA